MPVLDFGILGQSLLLAGFRDDGDALLHSPAEDHLRGVLVVLLRQGYDNLFLDYQLLF